MKANTEANTGQPILFDVSLSLTTSLFNGQLVIHDSRSKACCYATLAMSQDRLCERAVLGRPVLHGIRASCPSAPLVMGYNLASR